MSYVVPIIPFIYICGLILYAGSTAPLRWDRRDLLSMIYPLDLISYLYLSSTLELNQQLYAVGATYYPKLYSSALRASSNIDTCKRFSSNTRRRVVRDFRTNLAIDSRSTC